MVARDEVLLSQRDSKADSQGNIIHFIEGMTVAVYMDDYNEKGERDDLIADSIAVRNHHERWKVARWLLKINDHGVLSESNV